MFKLDGTFCRIYNLFLPKPRLGLSVNAIILKAYFTLTYSTVDEILALILFTGRGAIILKCYEAWYVVPKYISEWAGM